MYTNASSLTLVPVTALAATCVGAALVYAVERGANGTIKTFPDALWWAAATLTTAGYGDVCPVTEAVRVVAVVLMVVGVGLFGVLTARVAAFFVHDEERTTDTRLLRDIIERLNRIERRR